MDKARQTRDGALRGLRAAPSCPAPLPRLQHHQRALVGAPPPAQLSAGCACPVACTLESVGALLRRARGRAGTQPSDQLPRARSSPATTAAHPVALHVSAAAGPAACAPSGGASSAVTSRSWPRRGASPVAISHRMTPRLHTSEAKEQRSPIMSSGEAQASVHSTSACDRHRGGDASCVAVSGQLSVEAQRRHP